jgi:hypothetical protein
MYSSYNYHKFYNSTNNSNTFTINGAGNATVLANMAAATFSGNGAALTNLAYANITGTPTITNYVLKAGDTMSGNLTVNNITLASKGKINSYDDYHYIQLSQPTDTLTIQEFGTISFNIGITKTQRHI